MKGYNVIEVSGKKYASVNYISEQIERIKEMFEKIEGDEQKNTIKKLKNFSNGLDSLSESELIKIVNKTIETLENEEYNTEMLREMDETIERQRKTIESLMTENNKMDALVRKLVK